MLVFVFDFGWLVLWIVWFWFGLFGGSCSLCVGLAVGCCLLWLVGCCFDLVVVVWVDCVCCCVVLLLCLEMFAGLL